MIPIEEQTAQQKMKVLRELAYQNLGKKWDLFQKIKSGSLVPEGEDKAGLGEKLAGMRESLIEVTKLAHHLFRQAYLDCLMDISSAGTAIEDFPPPPGLNEDGSTIPIDEDQDAIIISRTPLKFLIPCGKLRQAGADLPQHRDGLVARIFFKVAAYYTIPENWDQQRITFYTSGLEKHGGELETKRQLEPLLKNIREMVKVYGVFDAGSLSSQGKKEQGNQFREAPEDRLRSMYWFRFTHQGMESFLLQYYMCLVTSTESRAAIRQLSKAFLPLLKKSILNRIHFDLVIDSDPEFSGFRDKLDLFESSLEDSADRITIDSRGTEFETWNFNSKLLDLFNLNYDNINPQEIESEWGRFISSKILNLSGNDQSSKHQPTPISEEARKYALTQIMGLLIQCATFKNQAKTQSIVQYRKRLAGEKDFLLKQQEAAYLKTKTTIKQMVQAGAKHTGKQQHNKKLALQKKVVELKVSLAKQTDRLKKDYYKRLEQHRDRLKNQIETLNQDQKQSPGLTSKKMIQLADELNPSRQFSKEFITYQVQCLTQEYNHELEVFYEQMEDILEPELEDKIALLHATSLHRPVKVEPLELSEEEEQYYSQIIFERRSKLSTQFPHIFDRRILLGTQKIPIDHLLDAGLDIASFKSVLRLKSNYAENLKIAVIPRAESKALFELNCLIHPLGANNILNAQKARTSKLVDPEISIDLKKLTALLPKPKGKGSGSEK